MKAFVVFLVLLQFGLLYAQYPSQLNFNIGDQLAYELQGTLDARGRMTSGNRSPGVTSLMDSTVVIQCNDMDATSYLFVMNMWDTTVDVGQGESKPSSPNNVGDWLGYDMYFQQLKTGEIVQVWYQEGDDPFLVQVKLGAINAFQTHIVPPTTRQQFLENDPVGSHLSGFLGVGQASSVLLVHKQFTQNDFKTFPDPHLHRRNVQMQALTSTAIHPSGFILSSSVTQMVDMISMNPYGSSEMTPTKRNVGDDTSALDFHYSSFGNLSIVVDNTQKAATLAKTLRSGFTFAELKAKGCPSGNMHEIATRLLAARKADVDLRSLKIQMFAVEKSKGFRAMDKLINYYQKDTASAAQFVWDLLSEQDLTQTDVRQRVLYVIAGIAHTSEFAMASLTTLMSDHIETVTPAIRLSAIYAANNVKNPTPGLVNTLKNIAEDKSAPRRLRNAALLVFGAVAGRCSDVGVRVAAETVLLNALGRASTASQVARALHAIGNAGPSVVYIINIPFELIHSESETVRAAFAHALRKFVMGGNPLAKNYLRRLTSDPAVHVRQTALNILHAASSTSLEELSSIVENSNFPFNKSYSGELTLGGSEVNIKFQGELFAGTNFDCNEQYFNYEVLAQATADAQLFDWSKNAFLAKAIYGKANGVLVGNEILVRIWDDVIYDRQLPTVDCTEHTYEIAHAAPGFSVEYVLWVSVIPVVFTASASLDLDLSWGWQVCDSDLSAMVELIPTATLVVSGDAEIDLLIIKAGVELDGSFNMQVRPQEYIHGSECEVGFDVLQDNNPMAIDFTAYYAWKECKYIIFDCHWGQHNQYTIFGWSLPANQHVLYNKDWKIAL